MRRLTWVLLCVMLMASLGLSASAAGELQAELEGERISGNIFATPVTLRLTPENTAARVLIKEKGKWMVLSPDETGGCRLEFAGDGGYSLRFCVEAADGTRSGFLSQSFTVDTELGRLLADFEQLPVLAKVGNSEVEANRETIVALYRRYQELTDAQRALVPQKTTYALSRYLPWLDRMKPGIDVLPPEPPLVEVEGETPAPGVAVYRPGAKIVVRPKTKYDFDGVYVRLEPDGEWLELEQEGDAFALLCSEPGAYRYRVCARDAAGNGSAAESVELVVSQELFDFHTAAHAALPAQREKALASYYELNMYTSSLVDEAMVRRLRAEYIRDCGQDGIAPTALADGKDVTAFGMLSAFPEGDARLSVAGAASTGSIAGSNKKILHRYDISFEGDSPQEPVTLCFELPQALLKRRGLAVFDSAGNEIRSVVRNEDNGFLLLFPVSSGGSYFVAATA